MCHRINVDGYAVTVDQPSKIAPTAHLTVRRGSVVLRAHQPGGPKPRQILEILLVHLGRPVSKDRLIELLWGATPPLEALPALESYVSVPRRHVQPGAGKFGPLRTTTGGYVLDRDLVDVDLDQFDVLLQRAQKTKPCLAYPLLLRALNLAVAPLLADELVPAWAAEAREPHASRLTSARILATETAATLHRIDDTIDFASLALADHRRNERAWAALIHGLETSGRHAEGLQAYERCRQALQSEIGCAPGALLRSAQQRLLQATAIFRTYSRRSSCCTINSARHRCWPAEGFLVPLLRRPPPHHDQNRSANSSGRAPMLSRHFYNEHSLAFRRAALPTRYRLSAARPETERRGHRK